MTDPCARCGQPHVTRHGTLACSGHLSHRDDDGNLQPCSNPPITGADKCRYHGAGAPQVRAAAERRLDEADRERALQRGLSAAYGDQVPDVDPAEAMLRAVSWKYAECLALRTKVAELDDDQRVWGATRVEVEGSTALRIDFDSDGVSGIGSAPSTKRIETAGPNIWWQMLRTAETQLVQFAKDARAAGCDERRVKLAEDQGEIVVGLIRRILDGLFLRLVESGVPEGVLREAWDAAVSDVVPRELRAAAIGGA